MREQDSKSGLNDSGLAVIEDALAARDGTSVQPPESGPVPQEARKPVRKRKLVAGVPGVAVLAVLLVFGIP